MIQMKTLEEIALAKIAVSNIVAACEGALDAEKESEKRYVYSAEGMLFVALGFLGALEELEIYARRSQIKLVTQ